MHPGFAAHAGVTPVPGRPTRVGVTGHSDLTESSMPIVEAVMRGSLLAHASPPWVGVSWLASCAEGAASIASTESTPRTTPTASSLTPPRPVCRPLEQSAAFIAATHGRLTGQTRVCLSTLGPGALNPRNRLYRSTAASMVSGTHASEHISTADRVGPCVVVGRSGLGEQSPYGCQGLCGCFCLDADAFHDGEVVLDVGALVEVDRAGELLEIDDVGKIRFGKAQDGERPPAAAWAPLRNGSTCTVTFVRR